MNNSVIHGKYFPHIDGIRTIAVLSVVLFHIFGSLCPGGYVGVDVFFVISGYLITGGILKSLEKGNFSIKDFYTRRIRRIIPAYVVLVAFVLIIAILILPPLLMGRVFSTTVSSSTFATNLFLYLKTGYFDSAADKNPLLHLWSLGVEEQFYIFIPLLLFWVYKISKKAILPFLIGTILLSLALSVFCTQNYYNNFNFYMLPTRAWELLAGSLLAYFNRTVPATHTRKAAMYGILGMMIVVGTCYLYTSRTSFPGLTALPPVLGTCLMIRWGNQGIARPLLESKPFTGIGKISYSLYLWHWPLIVYWNYIFDDSKNPWGLTGVFLLSLLLGWLSWKFVEMPVRLSKSWNFKKAFWWVFLGCGALGISGVLLLKSNLISKKQEKLEQISGKYWDGAFSKITDFNGIQYAPEKILSKTKDYSPFIILGNNQNPCYLLWGDSHAMALSPGLHNHSKVSGHNGLFLNIRTAVTPHAWENIPKNNFLIKEIFNWLKDHSELKTIILTNRWALLSEGYGNEAPDDPYTFILNNSSDKRSQCQIWEEGLREICHKLQEMNKNVIIISSVPEQGFDVATKFYKNYLFGYKPIIGVSYTDFTERQKNVDRVLRSLENEGLAKVIWITDFFYPDKKTCKIIDEEGKYYYKDDDHLNPNGARALMKHYYEEMHKAMTTD